MVRRRRNSSGVGDGSASGEEYAEDQGAHEEVIAENLESDESDDEDRNVSVKVFRVSHPSIAEDLMQKYGVTWRTHEGRRVLNVPSTAPEGAVAEICAALANE